METDTDYYFGGGFHFGAQGSITNKIGLAFQVMTFIAVPETGDLVTGANISLIAKYKIVRNKKE